MNAILTFLTLVGFVFVAQPSFIFGGLLSPHATHVEGFRWLGIMYALTCSISAALSTIIVRKLGFNIHFSLTLLYYSVENVVFIACFRFFSGQTFSFCSNYLSITFLAGLSLFTAQTLTTMALQRQKAGPISLIRSSEIVFVFLLQYLVLGEAPTVLGGIGATMILFVCLMLSMKSIWKAMKKKHWAHS